MLDEVNDVQCEAIVTALIAADAATLKVITHAQESCCSCYW